MQYKQGVPCTPAIINHSILLRRFPAHPLLLAAIGQNASQCAITNRGCNRILINLQPTKSNQCDTNIQN